jgi:hypothetical protein
MTQRSRCTDRAASAFSIGNGPLVEGFRFPAALQSRSQGIKVLLTDAGLGRS